jgi:hypothetical protein
MPLFGKRRKTNWDDGIKVRNAGLGFGDWVGAVPFWDNQTWENSLKPFIEVDLWFLSTIVLFRDSSGLMI